MSPKPLGLRALEYAQTQLWVRESPPGSNTGPEIAEYFDPCVRGDNNARLGLRRGNWCAAFASACMYRSLLPGEAAAHGYRAGVVEIVADAASGDSQFSATWQPVKRVRDGDYVPVPGDLAIYDRSQPGRPDTAWWRHVNRISDWQGLTYAAIGGNEADGVRIGRYSIDDAKLLGVVAYPRAAAMDLHAASQPPKAMLSDAERSELQALVAMSLDAMIRQKLYG